MKINVTTLGVEMILHCLEGGPSLRFASLVLGNGADAGTSASEMSNPLQTIPISAIDREEGSEFVKLTGILNNSNVVERFRATELGVLAEDPDNEGEYILFAYGYSPEEEATVIPSATDYAFETTQNVFVYVGKTEDVTAIVSESVANVSRAEFQQHLGDNRNPHAVSAMQVGLGNVPNVTTDDQTPTIEYLKWAYTGKHTDLTGLDLSKIDPANGEQLKTLLGKICSVTKEALRHIANTGNPHNTRYSQAGGAASTHYHSASNITSGTLPAARGGTGVTSTSALANLLSSYFSFPVFGVYTGDGSVKRKIELPFTPSAILVANEMGMFGDDVQGACGGIAIGSAGVAGYNCSTTYASVWNDNYTALMITTNGFYVNYSSSYKVRTNTSGRSYRYIAWR